MPVAPQGEVKGRPGAVCLSGAGREGAGEAQGESRAQTRWGAPAQSGGSEVPVRSSRKLRSVQRPAWHGPEGNWCRAAAAVATASPLRNVRPQTQTVGSRCRVPPATASTREGCHTQRPRTTPTTLHLTHRECTLSRPGWERDGGAGRPRGRCGGSVQHCGASGQHAHTEPFLNPQPRSARGGRPGTRGGGRAGR